MLAVYAHVQSSEFADNAVFHISTVLSSYVMVSLVMVVFACVCMCCFSTQTDCTIVRII